MKKRPTNKEIRQSNALEFHVSESINVKMEPRINGRVFAQDAVQSILKKYKKYADCYGCYVYSVKAGKGFTPIYVGSATRQPLGKEAFGSDKFLKCLQHIASYKNCSLQISFVVPRNKVDSDMDTHRGRCPRKKILKMEKILTAIAFRKNNNLINKQNLCFSDLFINGVLNSDAGRPRKEVSAFKKLMGLNDKTVFVLAMETSKQTAKETPPC